MYGLAVSAKLYWRNFVRGRTSCAVLGTSAQYSLINPYRLAQVKAVSLSLRLARQHPQGLTLVEQLVEAIGSAIDEHRLQAGSIMPSVRQLAQERRISTFTVAESYTRLVARGYLTARRGSSYMVASQLPARKPPSMPHWEAPSLNASWLLSEVFADRSIPIKAGAGWLPSAWLNEDGLHQALRSASRIPMAQLSGYGHPYGSHSLRAQIAIRLRAHGMACEESQVVLTHGATHALDLVVRTVLQPGDTVVVEDPCYCNLLQILKLASLHAIGVARTPHGIDTDALEDILRAKRAKAIFVNPVLQNPTGTTLPVACAYRVLQITERYGAWIVEDDIYRELAPAGSTLIAAMDGLRRVIYVGGFSKTVTPSMRVGFVVAAPEVVQELARAKMAVGLTTSEVAERLVHSVLMGGHYDSHVTALAERLKRQHREVGEMMDASGVERMHAPEGGLFVWGRISGDSQERDARDIAVAALKEGIWLAPGSYFRPMDLPTPWFRFNVATSNDAKLWAFFKSLQVTPARRRA